MNVNKLIALINFCKDYQANDVLAAQKLLFSDPYFDDYNEILYAGIIAPLDIGFSEEDYKEEKEEEKEIK